jgi:beta-glucosidase
VTQTRDGVTTAEFEIKNVGPRAGAEVVQLYVEHLKPRLSRPVKELKGFRKIFLKAGESQNVSIALERSAFAFYDPERRAWAAEKGDYKIVIGASSRDIRLQENVRLTESTYEK